MPWLRYPQSIPTSEILSTWVHRTSWNNTCHTMEYRNLSHSYFINIPLKHNKTRFTFYHILWNPIHILLILHSYPNHSNYPIHILVISYHYPITHLVGCFNSSENMKVSWDHYSQYMESHKKCSKPPTSYPITHCIAWFSLQIFKPPKSKSAFHWTTRSQVAELQLDEPGSPLRSPSTSIPGIEEVIYNVGPPSYKMVYKPH